jgi:hypothetical protein
MNKQAVYKNSFYSPEHKGELPEFTTDATPIDYKGFQIYQYIKGSVWHTVKDGVCIAMNAGPNGAKRRIDEMTETESGVKPGTQLSLI